MLCRRQRGEARRSHPCWRLLCGAALLVKVLEALEEWILILLAQYFLSTRVFLIAGKLSKIFSFFFLLSPFYLELHDISLLPLHLLVPFFVSK